MSEHVWFRVIPLDFSREEFLPAPMPVKPASAHADLVDEYRTITRALADRSDEFIRVMKQATCPVAVGQPQPDILGLVDALEQVGYAVQSNIRLDLYLDRVRPGELDPWALAETVATICREYDMAAVLLPDAAPPPRAAASPALCARAAELASLHRMGSRGNSRARSRAKRPAGAASASRPAATGLDSSETE